MSFLTTFPEDVYPTHRLAAAIEMDGFSIDRAQACMWMAQAAYETTIDRPLAQSPCKLERLLARWGFDRRAELSKNGTEGFVAESTAALVVAFAGTDPIVADNWMLNFDIRTTPDGIHRGFCDGVANIWDALIAAITGTEKPIVLTGHSLGGALAVVTAARLAADGDHADRIATVLTFGMPRVGLGAFAEAYRSRRLWDKTIRLSYGSDIVPTLPPATVGQAAFQHVGLSLHCPHGGEFSGSLPPRDAPEDDGLPSSLEQALRLLNSETMRKVRDLWGRVLDHGVPQSPAAGAAQRIIDKLPFFLRDHLQDCYLEALGWRFAHAPEEPAVLDDIKDMRDE